MFITPDPVKKPLHVIVPLFNPIRYKSRWKHWRRFVKYATDCGATVITVEAAFGAREHACHQGDIPHGTATVNSPTVVKVRGQDELWVKESLINRGLAALPPDAEYIAWIDADVVFADPAWVGRTVHALQHYDFVQMFSWAQDLDPNFNPVGKPVPAYVSDPGPTEYSGGHRRTGLAWAARRDALDHVGGLLDVCVLGSADWHMAKALQGVADTSYPEGVTDGYKHAIAEWEYRAQSLRRGVGAMPGLLLHYWHGKKVDRHYSDRWKPLVDLKYDPRTDIKRNTDGIWQLCRHGARGNQLRDAFRAYFRSRNEDSIDV